MSASLIYHIYWSDLIVLLALSLSSSLIAVQSLMLPLFDAFSAKECDAGNSSGMCETFMNESFKSNQAHKIPSAASIDTYNINHVTYTALQREPLNDMLFFFVAFVSVSLLLYSFVILCSLLSVWAYGFFEILSNGLNVTANQVLCFARWNCLWIVNELTPELQQAGLISRAHVNEMRFVFLFFLFRFEMEK